MVKKYIVELFEEKQPFVHAYDICKRKLLTINRIHFVLFFDDRFEEINLDEGKNDDYDSNEFSSIKSLGEF